MRRTIGLVAMAVLSCPVAALAASRFDGHYAVTLVCDRAPDGALGYTFQFFADVKDGQLHAEHGVQGHPAYLLIEGQIAANGDAAFLADGLTGHNDYNLGRVDPGLAYTYRIKAHFDGGHGTGARTSGARKCALDFTRL